MNANWLADLAPEHAPAAPGWWPPAPGWWGLALLATAVVAGLVLWWRSPRRRLRSATLRELRRLRAAADAREAGGEASPDEGAATAQALQNLLRRYALARYGRESVARLSGAAWLNFLTEISGDAFGGNVGESLLAAAYGGPAGTLPPGQRDGWFKAAEKFVRAAARRRRRPRR